MNKIFLFLLILSGQVLANEKISSQRFNDFTSEKEQDLIDLSADRENKQSLLTNQISRADSRQVFTTSQYVDYANNTWFTMNNLNSFGTGPFLCETTFDTTTNGTTPNGNTVGGKLNYILVRNGTYNENSVAKACDVSFTAEKTNITSVSFRILSQTGQANPLVQFYISGDATAATFHTKCVKMAEVLP